MPQSLNSYIETIVTRYRAEMSAAAEYLSLLRWQISQGHALEERTTFPGHITTSAIIVSPDHSQLLLIDHVAIGRWLQPGGHYEPATHFYQSAAREAIEETGVGGLTLHPWHRGQDIPFAIDSQDVRGKQTRGEPDHVHHDLQYLFVADPSIPLTAQRDEVHSARWEPISNLHDISPKAAIRFRGCST